jgi:hypothetical protein
MNEEFKIPEEEIVFEDREPAGEDAGAGDGKVWTEEMKVTGAELLETIKKLVHEAGVRHIVIRNKQGRTLLEIPMVLGVAGIALLPVYAAVGLLAAMLTEHSILVVRAERTDEKEPEVEAAAD